VSRSVTITTRSGAVWSRPHPPEATNIESTHTIATIEQGRRFTRHLESRNIRLIEHVSIETNLWSQASVFQQPKPGPTESNRSVSRGISTKPTIEEHLGWWFDRRTAASQVLSELTRVTPQK